VSLVVTDVSDISSSSFLDLASQDPSANVHGIYEARHAEEAIISGSFEPVRVIR
jgi:hypothetical protein